MKDTLTLITILIIIIVLSSLLKNKKLFSSLKSSPEHWPFKAKKFLMDIPERKFFEKLQKIIPDDYVALPQISLQSIVEIGTFEKNRQGYQNKIDKKIMDFVIFKKPYYEPVLVIEYNGRSHNLPSRIKRDNDLIKILESANINLIFIKHQKELDWIEINKQILEKLKIK